MTKKSIRTTLFEICAFLCGIAMLGCVIYADDLKLSPGVSPSAKDEILRRRDRVQELGTIQATPAGMATEALGPPPNDNHKFFITIVTCAAPQWAESCNKLLTDVNTNEHFRAWVKKDDPDNSWAHYQVRRIEDVTQEWWFEKVKDLLQPRDAAGKATIPLDANGKPVMLFPAIVIQPPIKDRDSRGRVVAFLRGYDGNPEHTSELIGKAIDEWNVEHSVIRSAAAGGHGQLEGSIGAPPVPFVTPPTAIDPFEPTKTQVATPERLKRLNSPPTLSVKQIQDLCPGAPAAFIRDQHRGKPTDPDVVSLEWMAYQDEHKPKPAPPAPAAVPVAAPKAVPEVEHDDSALEASDGGNFPKPAKESAPWDVLPVLVALLIVIVGAMGFRQHTDAVKLKALLESQTTRSEKSNGPTANGIEPSA